MEQAYDIKLVGLDIDGTLLNSAGRLTPRTKAAIVAALQKGCRVIPATGRPFSGLPAAFTGIPGVDWAVTANGATVFSLPEGRVWHKRWLPAAAWFEVWQATDRFDRVMDLFVDGSGYNSAAVLAAAEDWAPPGMAEYMRFSRRPVQDVYALAETLPEIEKTNLFFKDPAQRAEAWAMLEADGRFEVCTSSQNGIELSAKGATKAAGLLGLAEHLGLDAGQVMACGDSGNDIPMLRAAGVGVAMGNASQQVKAHAAYVTDTNDRDGVAKALERFVLGLA